MLTHLAARETGIGPDRRFQRLTISVAIGGRSGHSWRMLKPTRVDPSRHFATVNCRIAKGSRNPADFLTLGFTADRGRAISRDTLRGRLPVLLHGERAFILDLPT